MPAPLITPEGGRIGAMQRIYYTMCEDAFLDCSRIAAAQSALPPDEVHWSEEDFVLNRRALTSSISCIVFAGMCLEAAIYDYAGWHLPEDVIDGLEKMDFIKKWLVIPFLVCGQSLPKGGVAYNALKELTALRNKLIHSKSRPLARPEQLKAQIEDADRNEAIVRDGYIAAMKAIICVSLQFDQSFTNTINPLPHFGRAAESAWTFVPRDVPAEVHALISECRRSIRKSSPASGT